MNGGSIDTAGTFQTETGDAFVILVVPRSDSIKPVMHLDSDKYRGVYESLQKGALPIVANEWNPFLFYSLTVTSEMLDEYNFYWGAGKLSNQ